MRATSKLLKISNKGTAGNLVLTTKLKPKLATVRSKKAHVSSVSPSSDRLVSTLR